MNAWMAFEYDSNKPLEENIFTYKKLTYALKGCGLDIKDNTLFARLLTVLPRDWHAFRSSWNTKPEPERSMQNLLLMMRNEVAQRKLEEGVQEITALTAKTTIRRRRRYVPQHFQQSKQSTSRNQSTSYTRKTEITCWTCGGKNHTSRVCPKRQQRKKPKTGAPTANFSQVFMAEVSSGANARGSTKFVVDSGSTHHILNDPRFFETLTPLANTREIRLANSTTLQAQGVGDAILNVHNGKRVVKIRLLKALYAPSINTALISVSQLCSESRYKVVISPQRASIITGKGKATAHVENGLYVLTTTSDDAECLQTQAGSAICRSLKKAHSALAHINRKKVEKVLKMEGIKYVDDLHDCLACVQGKQHKPTFKSKPNFCRASRPGYCHADLCSASQTSLGGANHFLAITDDFSKFRKVYFLKTKDEAADCI